MAEREPDRTDAVTAAKERALLRDALIEHAQVPAMAFGIASERRGSEGEWSLAEPP